MLGGSPLGGFTLGGGSGTVLPRIDLVTTVLLDNRKSFVAIRPRLSSVDVDRRDDTLIIKQPITEVSTDV